jgi:hypothetical protein
MLRTQLQNHVHHRRTSLVSAVAVGRIEQSGETSSIKLIRNFCDSGIRLTLFDPREERRHPCDKSEL